MGNILGSAKINFLLCKYIIFYELVSLSVIKIYGFVDIPHKSDLVLKSFRTFNTLPKNARF